MTRKVMHSPVHLLVLLTCAAYIRAEVRFVCPRPQSPKSSLTDAPCGKNAFSGTFEDDFMEVRPGLLTVRFEDTAHKAGSPSRISLGQWGNDPKCVLLDHIPSRDKPPKGPTCPAHTYPLGACGHLSRYITVNIPDIHCDKCYLQLMSVLTSENGACVEDKKTLKVNCTAFYSCANIRIIPTRSGAKKTLLACTDYASNLKGYWPYIQTVHSHAVINAPFLGDTNVNISFDDNFLRYNIRLKGEQLKVHTAYDRMAIVTKPRNSTVFIVLLKKFRLSGKFKSFASLISELQRGALAVEFFLSQSNQGFYFFNLKPNRRLLDITSQSFYPGVYTPHTQKYSAGGWLKSSDFIGPGAAYPSVITPSGACAPPTRSYGTLLKDNGQVLRAIVHHDILDHKCHVTGVFSNKLVYPYPIVYKPNKPTPGVKSFSIPHVIFNRDILPAAILPFVSKYPELLTKVSTKVSVMDSATLLRGIARKSIKIRHALEDEFFGIHAIMIPEEGPTWTVTVMIIRKRAYFRKIEATVFLRLPTHDIRVLPESDDVYGRWVGTARITIVNSSVSMYLWMGVMSLHTKILYNGKHFVLPRVYFEPVRTWHCVERVSNICWKTDIWPKGGGSMTDEIVPTHGVVTFFIPPASNRFMYTVTLMEISDLEKVTGMVLSHVDNRTILSLAFGTGSKHQEKSVTIDGISVLSWADLNSVKSGDTILSVSMSHSVVRARIPPQNTVSDILPKSTSRPPTSRLIETTQAGRPVAGVALQTTQSAPIQGDAVSDPNASAQTHYRFIHLLVLVLLSVIV